MDDSTRKHNHNFLLDIYYLFGGKERSDFIGHTRWLRIVGLYETERIIRGAIDDRDTPSI